MRGRKPAPTSLKILRDAQPCRVNASEPVALPEMPAVPEHLDVTARFEWHRLAPILFEMGVLTRADGPALAVYCAAYSRYRKASAAIRRLGIMVETGMGGWKTNPAVSMQTQAESTMLKVLAEFGCTPSSKSRIKVASAPPKDAMDEFLSKQG